MKSIFQNLGLMLTMLLVGQIGFAAPNWSVNSASYSLDFSVIATINYNGAYTNSTADMLGAFDAQGNVRGVANVVFNSLANAYVVNLTILGNTAGDAITFKLYNAADDVIMDAINKPMLFQPNALIGNPLVPYLVSNVNLPLGLHLDAPVFADSVAINTYVGMFSLDVLESSISNPSYTFTDSVGNDDTTSFYISHDSLFTKDTFDYDIDSVFTLKVEGWEQGYKVNKTFEVRVFNSLFLGLTEINEVEFKMFPNPSNGLVTIQLENEDLRNVSINVYDYSGKQVLNFGVISTTQTLLNVDELTKGIYLVEVNSNESRTIKRLVVY